MARIKVDLPAVFSFHTIIPVRITDLNYGGHVGNDAILSLVHEARMQYLQQWRYSEKDLAGAGMIMADAAIEFRNELFYGEVVKISIAAGEFTRVSFDLFYKLEKTGATGESVLVAAAKTGMVCFDYSRRKVTAIPEEALWQLQNGEL